MRDRRPLKEVSGQANLIGNVVATILSLIATPLLNFICHGKLVYVLVLSSILYLVVFFYARVKAFDWIDGA
jgi:hypothetical protein